MSKSNILLANDRRIATRDKTESGVIVHVQRVELEDVGGLLAGDALAELLADAGVTNLNVDGSAVAKKYRYVAGAGKEVLIRSLLWYLRDDGTVSGSEFGALATLANGLQARVIDTDLVAVKLDLLAGGRIKSNADLARLAGPDYRLEAGTGAGNELVAARWDLAALFGKPLQLVAGEALEVVVNDNLTGLAELTVQAFGEVRGS